MPCKKLLTVFQIIKMSIQGFEPHPSKLEASMCTTTPYGFDIISLF